MIRQQTTRVTTLQNRKLIRFAVLAVITLLLSAAIVFVYLYEFPSADGDYIPPPFEENALAGIPELEEHMQFAPVDAQGQFTFGSAGTLFYQKDSSLKLYLTNFEENDALIMAEVYDPKKKKVIYKSGLLRPGEYVESLTPLYEIENVATDVEVRVYAFSQEDYVSVGQVALSNIIQPNHS